MTFKQDFLVALCAGVNYHTLMELVGRHRAQGLSVDTAYQVLHEIWMEHDFDKTESEEGTLQDALEAVMEKVWYGQPVL